MKGRIDNPGLLNFYNLCDLNNTDMCEVKANQCGIMFPDMKFGTGHDKNKEFIGNITYLSCDEVEKMHNTKEINGDVAGGMGQLCHSEINYIVIGVLSGVILILVFAMVTYSPYSTRLKAR